jgi:hypothetical protein
MNVIISPVIVSVLSAAEYMRLWWTVNIILTGKKKAQVFWCESLVANYNFEDLIRRWESTVKISP